MRRPPKLFVKLQLVAAVLMAVGLPYIALVAPDAPPEGFWNSVLTMGALCAVGLLPLLWAARERDGEDSMEVSA